MAGQPFESRTSVITCDTQGIVHEYAADAADMFGWTQDEVLGKMSVAMFHVPKNVPTLVPRLSKQARDERRDVLRHMKHRDGHLAEYLVLRPSEHVGRVRRVLVHDALRVAGDDRGPRLEGLSGHRELRPRTASHGRRGGSRGCVIPM